MRKFVLVVNYGTGKASMVTDTPDMVEALKEFMEKRLASMPDSKYFGLPLIQSAELLPLLYDSVYEQEGTNKNKEGV